MKIMTPQPEAPSDEAKPNLVYTVVLDPPGSEGYRMLAKMLASSLVRTGFLGDVLVFRNSSAPLFLVERKGVEEVFIETKEIHGAEGAEHSWCWKYKVRHHVTEWMEINGGVDRWNKVMFIDADCLALRNIDHLLEGDWDIAFQTEKGRAISEPQYSMFMTDEECQVHSRDGVNSGTLAVSAEHYLEVMGRWEQIDQGPAVRRPFCRDQGSWNRLLVETEMRTRLFDDREIQFPVSFDPQFKDYKEAAIVHNLGVDTVDKIRFTFGLYMGTFFCDPSALFFNFLEM